MTSFYSIPEARSLAKRYMPRLMFDFVDGAAGDDRAKANNAKAISDIQLQPRVLVNVDKRQLNKQFLGRTWDLPFGIAPMGMCNLTWPKADQMLAKAAAKHNIPHAISTMSSTSLEDMYAIGKTNIWFQLYVSQSVDLAIELVDRALAAGYDTLIFTVDVPQVAPRRRDRRNGFQVPFRMGLKQFWDFATHPRWSLSTLWHGSPRLMNIETSRAGQNFSRQASRGLVDWAFLDQLRARWPHKLVVKGVMSVDDAQRVQAAGADAIYVSNHGGRQLDSAPPTIQMLPRIRQAVGPDYPLILDGGVRDGDGILKALALGADFVMLGRPFLYALGAAQTQGLTDLIDMLRTETSVTMAQLGKTDLETIDQTVLVS